MKKIKLNNNNVTNIIRETLKHDGVFITNSKIDSVINRYLIEREDNLLDDETPIDNDYVFSPETNIAFGDMIGGLTDTIEDLNIIQTSEESIIIPTYSQDVYSEDYLEEIISDLESVVERLEFLKGLE